MCRRIVRKASDKTSIEKEKEVHIYIDFTCKICIFIVSTKPSHLSASLKICGNTLYPLILDTFSTGAMLCDILYSKGYKVIRVLSGDLEGLLGRHYHIYYYFLLLLLFFIITTIFYYYYYFLLLLLFSIATTIFYCLLSILEAEYSPVC